MLLTLVLMTAVMLIIDSVTYVVIKEVLEADISFLSLVMYRIVINVIAFLLAISVKSPVKLYHAAVALTIIGLALQLVMPVIVSLTGLSLISSLHPVQMFVENELNILWFILSAVLILIWIWRDNNAGS
jgi:di/tricarboxylate transporter